MARAGLSRLDVKRARDSLMAQGQHPSIDAIRIALGNTGSKTTIHRYLKELEEEEGGALQRAGSTSDAILDLVGRLAARLHEEAQAVVDQQVAAATAQRQQVRAEADKLSADLVALRAELAQAHATVAEVRAAHSDTQTALQQRALEAERLAQQVQDLTERLAEHEGFRRSLEEKLQHAHQALEHFRNASKEQRDQEARRHEQQVQQLQAETRQANQALIVKQGEITQLNKDGARLVAEIAASAKRSRGLETQAEQAHAGLNQARVDQARAEAERDALRSAVQQQADELTAERAARERLAGELAKVTGRLDAQQQLLADYRTQLGVAGPAA
ncbi:MULTISPECIES: DNA-binding protein [Cupriavidus]|uniref:Cointegrate resolution protein T n=3 Tax=Cupriavidus TaxID=106589 RepID=A0A375FDA0_9BURK|nr:MULTISPECIES: DNA-binding protein [Cupriavidus]MCO4865969.1 DNA-binding protein [Cupriavidus sp. WGlv3]MCO4893592.1 DNA-binding protein [Cupriavidus sp. WGtm5]ULX55975.1 integrase [Cupriavidus taiwanensis]ULX56055.1 integrase [Cupriavidus taiwanensis]CAP63826.1 Cointegrate resolution protein T [Cupriavidus taiwanensis LMG 19424]